MTLLEAAMKSGQTELIPPPNKSGVAESVPSFPGNAVDLTDSVHAEPKSATLPLPGGDFAE